MTVSILNGINAFLLALINYLKLDARSEAHRTAAYKFDKLQSYMEFNSGRLLFDGFNGKASERLLEILQKVENDVREIKETNQFILPEKIRYTYSKLYSTNVFAEVKKIQNKETLHINKMKDYMNKILSLEAPTSIEGGRPNDKIQAQIDYLDALRRAEIEEVLKIKNEYLKLDLLFEDELKQHRESFRRHCDFCGWLKS